MEQSGSSTKPTTPPGTDDFGEEYSRPTTLVSYCVDHFRLFYEGFSYREIFRGATPIYQRYCPLCYDIDCITRVEVIRDYVAGLQRNFVEEDICRAVKLRHEIDCACCQAFNGSGGCGDGESARSSKKQCEHNLVFD